MLLPCLQNDEDRPLKYGRVSRNTRRSRRGGFPLASLHITKKIRRLATKKKNPSFPVSFPILIFCLAATSEKYHLFSVRMFWFSFVAQLFFFSRPNPKKAQAKKNKKRKTYPARLSETKKRRIRTKKQSRAKKGGKDYRRTSVKRRLFWTLVIFCLDYAS